MTSRQRTTLAVGLAVTSYASWIIRLVLAHRYAVVTGADAEAIRSFLDTALFSLAWSGFPAVGALLAVRRPDNPVGWTILVVGCSMYIFEPFFAWANLVAASGGDVVGPLLWMLGVANALTVLPIAAFAHLLLFFPNGVLTRWGRALSRVALVATAVAALARLLRPARLDMEMVIANPFGVAWMPVGEELVAPATTVLFMTAALALVRLVGRRRRADAVERQQFRWILWSVATLPPVWMLGNAIEEVNYVAGQFTTIAAFDLAFIGFTVALHRAVTKEDLYGIDRLVSRTLTYAGVSAVLVATYLGLVVGLGAVARAVTGESGDLVVALSTLAVAALFQPLRQRMRTIVDRRFNRARYDADRTVEAFARGLRDQVSLAAVVTRLTEVSRGSFHPSVIGVTLVAGARR